MKKSLAIALSAIIIVQNAAPVYAAEASVQAGDTITMGAFEQDGDYDNGDEPIEWLVLDIDEETNRALVISKYGLTPMLYNINEAAVTWETSYIREFLNEELLPMIFTDEEAAKIVPTQLENPDFDAEGCKVEGGNSTEDMLFVLSKEDVETYFKSEEDRKCQPTVDAIAGEAWVVTQRMVKERPFAYSEDEVGYGAWWIRDMGCTDQCAQLVYADGSIPSYTIFSENYKALARPAMWIQL